MGWLGAHISIAGGVDKSPGRGEDLGCQAVQIFSKNQRQWHAPPISVASAKAFREAWHQGSLKQVVIHDSYLINLANPNPEASKKSRMAFLDEIDRADQLGIPSLVFHPGAHMKTNIEAGIQQIANALNEIILQRPDSQVQLLLETTAGMGDSVGWRFEQLADLISCVEKKEKMGVCLDTAHVFEAGYDIRSTAGYENTISEFDNIIGLDQLKVFHLNDSKTDLDSRVDRHENIGKGFLGEEPFRCLVNDSRFLTHPMILEIPGGEDEYKQNLDLLRSFQN